MMADAVAVGRVVYRINNPRAANRVAVPRVIKTLADSLARGGSGSVSVEPSKALPPRYRVHVDGRAGVRGAGRDGYSRPVRPGRRSRHLPAHVTRGCRISWFCPRRRAGDSHYHLDLRYTSGAHRHAHRVPWRHGSANPARAIRKARRHGQDHALTSDSPDLPVPSTVTVGRFYDYALVRLAPKPDVNGQYTATVTVSYGGASLARMITIDPGLSLVQITADPAEPDAISLNVLFTGVLPAGGETVQLASSNSAVTVSAANTFPAGSLGGEVTGIVVHPVTQNTKVRLSAALASRTLSAAYVLLAPFSSHDHITVSAGNGAGGIDGQDFNLQYNVTLSNPAPDSGINVTLAAADPSLQIQTPTTNFIPPGFTTTSFFINVADVTTPVQTQLTATADGVTGALAVTIEPGLSSFTNVPATVSGGQSFTATVNLAGPVDTTTTVALQSSIGVLSVPLSVVIPAGRNSASFTATTVPVTSDTQAFITASLGTTQLSSSTVTITP